MTKNESEAETISIISRVPGENYDTYTLDDLQRIHAQLITRYEKRYPEPELDILHLAQQSLMRHFESVFQPAYCVQDRLF